MRILLRAVRNTPQQFFLIPCNSSKTRHAIIFLSFYFFSFSITNAQTITPAAKIDISPELKNQVMATLRESSRKFQVVSNDGQMGLPKSVVAYFSSGLQTVFVEKDRLRIVIRKPVSKKKNLQASFAGEKPSNAIPLKFKYNSFSIQFKGSDGFSRIDKGKPFETRRNFFSSQSKKRAITNVASYEELTLKNIYKGIDLRIYSQEEGQMEFDWIIWPGADPGKIRMQFRGQQSLTLSKQDGLQIHLSMGSLFMKMPESYYATPLGKVKSNCSFVITAKNEVRFKENQKHDSRYPLIIDPNLLWGTFFDGGSVTYFDEYLYSIVYNYNNGLIYCGGVANQQVSTAYAAALAYGYCGTFHTDSVKFGSPPGYGGVGVGQQDGFIYALTKNGQTIKYITYFGGTDSDGVTGISIGGTNVFVSGFTSSSDFPVTNGTGGTTTAFSSTLGGTRDGFVAVFSDSINHLLYSTYLGGSSIDRALTIRATGSNSFYVSLDLMGSLPTSSPNYLVNYANNSFSGPSEESWIGKFTNFNTLSFGTYIGGTASGSTTVVNDFQLLSNGDVVFAGSTTQIAEINGTVSGNTTGSDVLFGHIAVPASGSVTFTVVEKLGGSGTDHGNGIYALGDSVSILVGSTKSNNFPLGTGTPFQSSSGGSTDGFVARIRNDGTGGYKASYVGGSGSDLFVSVRPIIVGNQAALLCFGTTSSSNLPVINYNAETFYNATNSGGLDMMFLICDMNLNTKYYLSYIGGTDNDYLGATGTPVGSNHLFYNTVDSVLYVGTTTHSYDSTQNPKFVGRGINDVSNNGVPVFDQVKNNSNNDTHVIFAISTANIYSLLAAKWLSFDVKLNSGCGVRLIWTMTGETPGSQYTIERSSDSRYFEAIGTLVAGSQQYSYTDAAASSFTGILYYRIRSTEPGGYTSYSKINAVSLCDGGQESIKIYPTITSNYVSIKAQNFTSPKDVMIRLFDAFGNTVMQKRIRLVNGISQFLFDRRYSLGNYILSIKDQATGELLRQEKIIIRN